MHSSEACLHVIVPSPSLFVYLLFFIPVWRPPIFLLLVLPVNIQYVIHSPTSPLTYSIRSLFPISFRVIKFCTNLLKDLGISFSGLRLLVLAGISVAYSSLGFLSICLMCYFSVSSPKLNALIFHISYPYISIQAQDLLFQFMLYCVFLPHRIVSSSWWYTPYRYWGSSLRTQQGELLLQAEPWTLSLFLHGKSSSDWE